MKQLIKTDIFYFFRSKLIIWLILLFSLFSLMTVFMTFQYIKTYIDCYNSQLNYIEKTGTDIQQCMDEPYEILENNVIKNPLPYYKEVIETNLSSFRTQNTPLLFFETCTLFLPVITTIVSLLIVSYDDKNKTIRNKVTRNGKIKYMISKQISGLIISLFLMITAFVIMLATSQISLDVLSKNYDISSFSSKVNADYSLLLKQFVYTIISCVIYFEFSYTICNITKLYTGVALVICIGNFFLPPIFKYDIVNIKSTFENKIFTFNGVIHSNTPIHAPFTILIAESIFIILSLIILNYIVSIKRSSFN